MTSRGRRTNSSIVAIPFFGKATESGRMRSAGPGQAHPIFLVMQPRGAFPQLTISGRGCFRSGEQSAEFGFRSPVRTGPRLFPGRVRQRRRHIRTTERSAERSCVRRSQTDSVASDHKTFRTVARDTDKSQLIGISRPSAGSSGARRSSPSSKGVPALGEGWRMP